MRQIKSYCPKCRILFLHYNKCVHLQAFRASRTVLRGSYTEGCLGTEVRLVIEVKGSGIGKIKYLVGFGGAGIYIYICA